MSTLSNEKDGHLRSPLFGAGEDAHSTKEATHGPGFYHVDDGLVPVENDHSLKEVVRPRHDPTSPEVVQYSTYYDANSVRNHSQFQNNAYGSPEGNTRPNGTATSGDKTPGNQRRHRRKWLITGAIILLVIIIAAVLGGVLGTQLHKNDSNNSLANSSAPLSPTPSASPAPAALLAVNSSGIATASRLDGQGILMYFQAPNNTIIETFIPNSVLNSNSTSGDAVQSQSIVPIDDILQGSPLAVLTYTVNNTQFKQLFYANSQSRIMQINAPGMTAAWGGPTQASGANSTLRAGSSGLSACVSTTGDLKAVRLYFSADAGYVQELRWDFGLFDVTNMWITQYVYQHSDPAAGMACNIIQNGDGTTTLNVHMRNSTTGGLAHWYYLFNNLNTGGNWTSVPETSVNNQAAYKVASNAAFTSATDPSGANQYVFYGGADGNLKMITSQTGRSPTANTGVSSNVGPVQLPRLASYYINNSLLVMRQLENGNMTIASISTDGKTISNNTIVAR